ncbi:hypothetical protein OIV83_003947 [Microbotryomycetes sp. JL201]|nr:hypothetical protein OIV83_003947 [Microbotryomycetes sp. JL201]
MDIPATSTLSKTAFNGRVAVITGGSSGIGLATARLLASLGSKVVIGDLQPPKDNAGLDSNACAYVHADVTHYSSIVNLFETTVNLFGRVDVVFANSGIGERGTTFPVAPELPSQAEMAKEPKEGRTVIDIDLTGVIDTVRYAIYVMRRQRQAEPNKDFGISSIIVTASMAGYAGQYGLPVYNAAKHGVVGLVRSLRYHTLSHGIATSLVAPTITSTPILQQAQPYGAGQGVEPTQKSVEELTSKFEQAGVPMNTPDDVARVVAMIISLGRQAHGKGVLVQGGLQQELEGPLAKTRPQWLGQRMLQLYKGGADTDGGIGGKQSKL